MNSFFKRCDIDNIKFFSLWCH